MTYYKWTRADRTATRTDYRWPEPGVWTAPLTDLVLCARGYHLCDWRQLPRWINAELWVAEGRGEHLADAEKHVFGEARLVRRVKAWNERSARLLACDFAEHVQPKNADPRSLKAIEVARRYANGQATLEELIAARAAADAAAYYAAAWAAYAAADGDDARYAAYYAAYYAADANVERRWQAERMVEVLGLEKE